MNKQAMILTINLLQLIKGTDTCKNELKPVHLYSTFEAAHGKLEPSLLACIKYGLNLRQLAHLKCQHWRYKRRF